MTDDAKQEYQYILKIMHKAGTDNMIKVIWSAMHMLKFNPEMSIKEAMDCGYDDWAKKEEKE